MAAETFITPNFQAKDWEAIIGITDNSEYPDMKKMKFDLITYYTANGNPQGSTVIPVQIKEKTLLKIFQKFYENPTRNFYNDVGSSTFKRVIDIIRAKAAATLAAGPSDNYLTTQLAQEDSNRDIVQSNLRKNGRRFLMMESYDNS